MIQVKDPNGEPFEVTRRNANDLVQNLGWTYVRVIDEESLQTDLAMAPRDKGKRASKVQEARENAAAKKVPNPEAKVVGKKRAKKADEVVPVAFEESADTFDETGAGVDLEAELDALEAEEEARGKH
jgi:hypothetical protein